MGKESLLRLKDWCFKTKSYGDERDKKDSDFAGFEGAKDVEGTDGASNSADNYRLDENDSSEERCTKKNFHEKGLWSKLVWWDKVDWLGYKIDGLLPKSTHPDCWFKKWGKRGKSFTFLSFFFLNLD